jgi:hypothetical protein
MEQISEWFPSLEGITSAEWEIEYDDEGKSGLPSPSGYAVRGYITISEDIAQNYHASYDWSISTPHVGFRLISEERLGESQWLYNWEFEREIKGTFIGHIWFSKNTILFDGGK